ncbi:MAG: AAA family ATPase [Acidothermaceae bacterium]
MTSGVQDHQAQQQTQQADAGQLARRLLGNVEQVVHGRRPALELVACGLLAGGHVLVQDVPGSGKTTLARAFARSIGGTFRRIQATADLLPGDITGSSVWEPDRHGFVFVPGPVFAHVLLVDELNRATPRAQSALLEAMDEAAVTVDGVRHPLPEPFFVVATQNPTDQHGTYPLPEGQLDRFAIALTLGENDLATERQVVREQLLRPTVDDLTAVISPDELGAVQVRVRHTYVDDAVLDFALQVVRGTRTHPRVRIGASSRAALALVRCAQARAVIFDRDWVLPDDVKVLAPFVLGHRLVLERNAAQRAGSAVERLAGDRLALDRLGAGAAVVGEVLAVIPVPVPVPVRT